MYNCSPAPPRPASSSPLHQPRVGAKTITCSSAVMYARSFLSCSVSHSDVHLLALHARVAVQILRKLSLRCHQRLRPPRGTIATRRHAQSRALRRNVAQRTLRYPTLYHGPWQPPRSDLLNDRDRPLLAHMLPFSRSSISSTLFLSLSPSSRRRAFLEQHNRAPSRRSG